MGGGGGVNLAQGFILVLIFVPIRSFPSLEIWSAGPGAKRSDTRGVRRVQAIRVELDL